MPNRNLGTRVLMAIPTTKMARRSTSWITAMHSIQMPLGSSMGIAWTEDEDVDDARNQLCKKAVDEGCNYIFFLSDDVVPPPNVLLTLLDKIDRTYTIGGEYVKADMVTGVYWTKTYPPEPYLFNGLLDGTYKDWIAGEFFPVDMAGCDCLLINVEMLREIPYPWFSRQWTWTKEQHKPSAIATEDFYFYAKARKNGFRLFCDTSIQCLHEDRNTGVQFGLLDSMRQAGFPQELTTEYDGQLIADIGSGSGLTPWLYGKETRIIRFDMSGSVRPDVRCDVRSIPPNHFGIYDRVYASHVLEHFGRDEAQELIRHWCQLLKEGGTLEIHVPNLSQAFKVLGNPQDYSGEARKYAWQQIYGDPNVGGQPFHKNGFTREKLENLFKTVPELSDIKVVEQTYNHDNDDTNLKATATLHRTISYESLDDYIARDDTNGAMVQSELPLNGVEHEQIAVHNGNR